jgi:hypothetical protein
MRNQWRGNAASCGLRAETHGRHRCHGKKKQSRHTLPLDHISAELRADPVKLGTRWPRAVIRAESKAETVAAIPRKHVEMYVQHFLHGRFSVSQKEVHALTPNVGFPQRRGKAMGDSHERGSGVAAQLREIRRVPDRDHQDVSGIDGLNVHERRDGFITIYKGRCTLAGQNPAEDAVRRHDAIASAQRRLDPAAPAVICPDVTERI